MKIEKFKMSQELKMTAQFWLGVLVIIAGLTLLFLGFFAIPVGDIAANVLVAFGEAATFSGALIGVDYNYKYRVYTKNKDDEYRRYLHQNRRYGRYEMNNGIADEEYEDERFDRGDFEGGDRREVD